MIDDRLKIDVRNVSDLTQTQIDQVLGLFDRTYDRADHDYLLASFDVLHWIALARGDNGLIGFAVGDRCASNKRPGRHGHGRYRLYRARPAAAGPLLSIGNRFHHGKW